MEIVRSVSHRSRRLLLASCVAKATRCDFLKALRLEERRSLCRVLSVVLEKWGMLLHHVC